MMRIKNLATEHHKCSDRCIRTWKTIFKCCFVVEHLVVCCWNFFFVILFFSGNEVSVRITAENGVRLVVEFISSEHVGSFLMELKQAINSE